MTTNEAQDAPPLGESISGRQARQRVPRTSHGDWVPAASRADPLELLAQSAIGRLNALIPIRNARMAESPFAFFRGSAVVMAADLAETPTTGFMVQACGDAHCMNFGGYATPERNLIFDLNDFDETLRGPWEWDVKRLITSLVLAARHNGFKQRHQHIAAIAALQSYRQRIAALAAEPALNIWYARLDAVGILADAKSPQTKKQRSTIATDASTASVEAAVKKFTQIENGKRRFIEQPPELFHSAATDRYGFDVEQIFATYEESLRDDVRILFSRYRLIDHAIKVVGVGSVGTRCAVGLFQARDGDELILQIKEATPSVLEKYLPSSPYKNHGERVVQGQRLAQSASDVFLGWATSGDHDFYIRQFKDMKTSADIESAGPGELEEYATYCAWALAAAHARSGDSVAIAGYVGTGSIFDRAMLRFSVAYAEQAEADHAKLLRAIADNKVEALEEESVVAVAV